MKDNWYRQDQMFAPKRRVNNKLSWKIPHSIGYFYSNKMDRTVEYESLGERIFYYFLELDPSTIRYYVQPIEVGVPYIDDYGEQQTWTHIPDVLVFRRGEKPTLYQIKETNEFSKKKQLIDKACLNFAKKNGWEYKVVYPKSLPKEVIHNINFLIGFVREKDAYVLWIEEVLEKLRYFNSVSIQDVAISFKTKTDPLFILPVIYHLIASGSIYVNINEKISPAAIIQPVKGKVLFSNYFIVEDC
ncbi:TnsA endonuclease N-terminal domain-containing protein [Neobacillus drentensis]|uniref:TnsA endonuclease N-terminal domain-containing protein n=1 Tax=Neobacillus drentensis TaxID=220684 RepID=UPI002FFD937B